MRGPTRSLAILLPLLALVCLAGAARGSEPPPSGAGDREPLRIESLEFEGNRRTPDSIAQIATGLAAGDSASATLLIEAADRLRDSGLFPEVRVRARPGSRDGWVRVIFSVRENRPHLRFGLGYEDFSGWYLIPVQLNLDNATGRGERIRLSTRLGYRVAGLALSISNRRFLSTPAGYEVRLRAEGQQRIYFLGAVEAAHSIGRSGADLLFRSQADRPGSLETWISVEGIEPDSSAEVYRPNETVDAREGDTIPFEDLPPGIAGAVGRRTQFRIGAAASLDSRTGRSLSTRGVLGRLAVESVHAKEGDFRLATADLRLFRPIGPGGQIAVRMRAGAATREAPFYERFHLGGLYTIRGYPSQSLSPPEGDRTFLTASVELRRALIGPDPDPRLAGTLFVDAGAGGGSGAPSLRDGAAGIGYGLRLRVPWIGRLGLDVAHPLSPAPLDEAFHVNLGIGWTF